MTRGCHKDPHDYVSETPVKISSARAPTNPRNPGSIQSTDLPSIYLQYLRSVLYRQEHVLCKMATENKQTWDLGQAYVCITQQLHQKPDQARGLRRSRETMQALISCDGCRRPPRITTAPVHAVQSCCLPIPLWSACVS